MYYCDGHTHHHLDDDDDDNNDGIPLLLYNPSLPPNGNNHINHHHHNNLEEPLIHDDRFNGRRRRGVWIYLCFQCMDSFGLNHHHHSPPQRHVSDVENKPTVRVYCKAKTDFSLTVRDGQVILAPSNPFDPHQHWIKDEIFGKDVKDEEGFSSFALVNKATGLAIKHSIGVTYPVQLKEYNPEKLDKSLLWTMSRNLGDGYRAVRAVDNIHLNLDGCKGVKEHGGVRDGTKIILWEWNQGDNQKWTIVHY